MPLQCWSIAAPQAGGLTPFLSWQVLKSRHRYYLYRYAYPPLHRYKVGPLGSVGPSLMCRDIASKSPLWAEALMPMVLMAMALLSLHVGQ